MMKTKYSDLLTRFCIKYNKDHTATRIHWVEKNNSFYIMTQYNDELAKASNQHDLCIMLNLVEDTRTKKDINYWAKTSDSWFYQSNFLHEIITRYRRGH